MTKFKELVNEARNKSSPFWMHQGVGDTTFEKKFTELLILDIVNTLANNSELAEKYRKTVESRLGLV